MKFLLTLLCVISATLAQDCSSDICDPASGCICLGTSSPLPKEETPQFVILTFDDSVTDEIYKNYYEPILFARVNPDSNPISATFFVPHIYSDYERVNNLYNKGFEIAVHSISKNPLVSYWTNADTDTLIKEFSGQKQILNTFANIPLEDIKGVRTPFLQLAGNRSFDAYVLSELQYDNTWPTLHSTKLFPYTLDFPSDQQCLVGECPDKTYPGFFVAPITNLIGNGSQECNAIASCKINGTADEIKTWMIQQFEDYFNSNRAPLNLMINSAWFILTENSLEGYIGFLDYLAGKPEVFLVSHEEVLNWMKAPVPLSEYTTTIKDRNSACEPITCELPFGDTEIRYMRSCTPCPNEYPWVENPSGN